MTKLDYIDQSTAILKVVQMSLSNLKQLFSSLARESQRFLPRSLLKEYIIKRKLAEYLRLLIFQVTMQLEDLSCDANDLLVKLVTEFHELYSYFTMYEKDDFEKMNVVEVRKLEEL